VHRSGLVWGFQGLEVCFGFRVSCGFCLRGFSWSGDVDIQATEARGSIFIQLATEGASSAVQAIPNCCEQDQQCHG